jgi:hypothetical protein
LGNLIFSDKHVVVKTAWSDRAIQAKCGVDNKIKQQEWLWLFAEELFGSSKRQKMNDSSDSEEDSDSDGSISLSSDDLSLSSESDSDGDDDRNPFGVFNSDSDDGGCSRHFLAFLVLFLIIKSGAPLGHGCVV